MKLRTLAAAALLAAGSPATMAAVTFDAAKGTGSVGVSDVKAAFGWNDHQTKALADKVSFFYAVTTTYAGTCAWTTGNGKKGSKIHSHKHVSEHSVVTEVASSMDVAGTTYSLNGYGLEDEEGEVPVAGSACLGSGTDAVWEKVVLTGTSKQLMAARGPRSKPVSPMAAGDDDDDNGNGKGNAGGNGNGNAGGNGNANAGGNGDGKGNAGGNGNGNAGGNGNGNAGGNGKGKS